MVEMDLPFTMFVVSDLHLEFSTKPMEKFVKHMPDADVLILAGDIGMPNKPHFSKFLEICNESGKHELIIFVPGNHEYWSGKTDSEIEDICVVNDVIMLQNEMLLYKDVVFIGTTLWTNLTPLPAQRDLMNMNDFHRIPGMNVEKWKQLHNTAICTIKHYLDVPDNKKRKCIVITHHAPDYDCLPDTYHGDALNSCYYTNLQGLFNKPNLVTWIFGHTHKTMCKLVGHKKDTLLFGNSGRTPGEYGLKLGWYNEQNDIWNAELVTDITEYAR